jgi:hypothetical protein
MSSPHPSSESARGTDGAVGMPRGVDTGQRPLIRWRGWRPALWATTVVAVLLTWVVTFVGSAYETLLHAGVCHEPAQAADLTEAQHALVVLVLAAAAPWAVGLWRTGHRLRVGLFALLALAPVAIGAVQVLTAAPADYSMDWCLY